MKETTQLNGFTTEYGCKLDITTETSSYQTLNQADHKLEITIDIGTKHRYYQTTFSDLLKILENADVSQSQSRELQSYKS